MGEYLAMRIWLRKMKIPAALVAVLSISACDPGTFTAVEGISLMGTDKTLVDHVISIGSGKECSTVRREKGLTYCEEDTPVAKQNLYCYRDLGGVTCYDKPAPNRSTQQRVDRNEHNQADQVN